MRRTLHTSNCVRRGIAFTWMACLLLAPSAPALALSAAVPLKDFKHTVWLAKDGLPSDTLLAMQQTARYPLGAHVDTLDQREATSDELNARAPGELFSVLKTV